MEQDAVGEQWWKSDVNDGEDPADVPCGSKLFGLANALKLSDFRKPVYGS